jgi:glutamine cyclotransferase
VYQGFLIHNGIAYESTGLYGQSVLKRVDIESNDVIGNVHSFEKKFFGEGITIVPGTAIAAATATANVGDDAKKKDVDKNDEKNGDRIYMLTWREHTTFVFDLDFNVVGTHRT